MIKERPIIELLQKTCTCFAKLILCYISTSFIKYDRSCCMTEIRISQQPAASFVRLISLNSVILHNISRKVTSLLSVFFNGADDDIIRIQQTVCPRTGPVLLIK